MYIISIRKPDQNEFHRLINHVAAEFDSGRTAPITEARSRARLKLRSASAIAVIEERLLLVVWSRQPYNGMLYFMNRHEHDLKVDFMR